MNNNLNLASRPFNNRILPWTLTAIVLFFSIIGLVLVVHLITKANKQAALLQAETNALKQKEQALLQSAEVVKDSLTDDQKQALPAAHELIDRKRFSWSRLLADLEASLPANVKVSRIAVRDVTTDSNQTIAELELAVFAKSPTTITDMISSMHREGVFQPELRSQNLQKGRGETGTEYELDVIYRPRSGYSIESVAEVPQSKANNEVPK